METGIRIIADLWGGVSKHNKEEMLKYGAVFAAGLAVGSVLSGSPIFIHAPFLDFAIGTDLSGAAYGALAREHATSAHNLKELASRLISEYRDPATTASKRKKILAKGISFYLAPRSHARMFGRDVVIYNGKFKPTILSAAEHRDIYLLQLELLQLGGVEETVKKFRIGEDAYAWDQKTYVAALAACGLSDE
jgi:hypothetical protein